MSTEVANPLRPEVPSVPVPDPHFLERVGSIPIVTTTIDQLAQIYQYSKNTSPYMKYTLEKAEAGVKTVTQSALPIVNKLEKPIGAIDSIACSQLDILEEKFPIVTKPTEEVVEESKKVYESSVKPHVDAVSGVTQSAIDKVGAAKQYTVDTVTAVKDYSVNKVNDVKNYTYDTVASTATYGKGKLDEALETPGGQAVLSRVDQVLDKTEQYVDYYLPEDEKKAANKGPMDTEKERCESEVVANAKPTDVAYGKLAKVSDKVRRRMYAKTLRELQHVKKRSQETLERLNFTVDLIEYAKSNIDGAKTKATQAKDKFLNVWEEINKEEEEGIEMSNLATDGEPASDGTDASQISQATLEKRAIATARHLTSQLKRGFGTMMSSVAVLPSTLQSRVNDARTFSETLYTNFANAKTLEDIPATLVSQTRTQVVFLQDTINTYADYLRNGYFGSWLGSKTLEDMEGEGEIEGEEEENEGEETKNDEEEEKMDDKPASP